jgi:predicted Zn finger-like uncharacterized protein
MSQMNHPCPRCGAGYMLTADYLAQYGGQTTQCQKCGTPFVLPTALPAMPQTQWQGHGAPQNGAPMAVLSYAAPVYGAQPMQAVWSEGPIIVARKGAQLPYCCIKCGQPGEGKMIRKTFYWHEPWIYLTILAGLLVYFIVAMVVREKGELEYALCARHRARRNYGIWGGVTLLLLGIGSFVTAGVLEEPGFVAIGFLLFFAGLIWAALAARMLMPTKIDPQFIWLKGGGDMFVRTLQPARAFPVNYAPQGYPQR